MPNPKLQRYADRLRSLSIDGSQMLSSIYCTSDMYYVVDTMEWHEWVIKSRHVILSVFGNTSSHIQFFDANTINVDYELESYAKILVGIVNAALSDIEAGLVQGIEIVIASAIFDSVLEQAKHLNDNSYKDAAAVLGRTVIEDALRRLARSNSLDDTKKTAVINDSLKAANIYHQPMWRQVQAWIDIGNSAAHGNFHEYTEGQVRDMLTGIEQFLANYFV